MKNQPAKSSITRRGLNLCFPIHRIIDCVDAERFMFSGMSLKLMRKKTQAILVIGFINGQDQIVGIIPKGMMPHLEEALSSPFDYCVQLKEIQCSQLVDKMWIRIDHLPLTESLPI